MRTYTFARVDDYIELKNTRHITKYSYYKVHSTFASKIVFGVVLWVCILVCVCGWVFVCVGMYSSIESYVIMRYLLCVNIISYSCTHLYVWRLHCIIKNLVIERMGHKSSHSFTNIGEKVYIGFYFWKCYWKKKNQNVQCFSNLVLANLPIYHS